MTGETPIDAVTPVLTEFEAWALAGALAEEWGIADFDPEAVTRAISAATRSLDRWKENNR